MAERAACKTFRYEGAATRYRALMIKTRDPVRRRMLEEMIARELETVKRRPFVPQVVSK